MKKKKDKDVSETNKFVPFKQNISRNKPHVKPFIPLTIEDALDRQEKKDK